MLDYKFFNCLLVVP